MQLDLKTPFTQILSFSQELRYGALQTGGYTWLLQSFRRMRWVRVAQRQVLLDTPKVSIPDAPDHGRNGEQASLHWAGRILSLLLWPLRNSERTREDTRQLYVWLDRSCEQQGLIQGLVSEDYQRLQALLERVVQSFRDTERVRFEMDLIPKTVLLPGGEWEVPVLRSIRFIWLSEEVSAKTLIQIIQRDTFDLHAREFKALLTRVEELVTKNSDYVKSLYAYVEAETDDQAKRDEVFAERLEPLLDRLYADYNALVDPARARTGRRIRDLYDGLAALKVQSWLRVRRRFFVVGFRRYADQLREWWDALVKWQDKMEQRVDGWLDEYVKPALGVTQPARIVTREYLVPEAWLREPELPDDLVTLLRDRRNPALLEVPSPILRMVKTVRDLQGRGNLGGGLLLTENLAGGMGLLAYAMSLYFRNTRYRVYRHTHTRALEKWPDFGTDVVFLENFERMVLLDRDHLPAATELIERLFESETTFILSVHYRVAERLRLAVPAFSRFPVELTFTKYELGSFIEIIRKRMAISGYTFYTDDENEFWSELYRASSGIPGVGLELFLRCIRQEKDERIRMAFDLPSMRGLFGAMQVDEMLLLRRVYRQPFLSGDMIPKKEFPLLMMLENTGLIAEQHGYYAIRKQFYGIVREQLQSRNL